MTNYYRPIPNAGPARPLASETLAGGWTWFSHVEVLQRGKAPEIVDLRDIPGDALARLTRPRARIAGLSFETPRVMGILNITPDSFSDGGQHRSVEAALAGARMMAGVDILDIGGESTRPGARFIEPEEEIDRVVPVIAALKHVGISTPLSIDTRKVHVARAAVQAGAGLVNDVSGFTFDTALAPFCARHSLPVCVMHAQGDPTTMQDNPRYDDVLLDVYDFLAERIGALTALGVPQDQIIVDPGIGFGKTLDHNLALLARLSVFHSLGVPMLVGASRKRFIGTLGKAEQPRDRMPGSVAVALAALTHGTQIVRVHDVPETIQAIALWQAVMAGKANG